MNWLINKVRYLLREMNYKSNMNYTFSKIFNSLKKKQSICIIEYSNVTETEINDIVARLKYLGYDVFFSYTSYELPHPSEIRIRLKV